ncbi:ATP-binding cassette domain-containing protein [Nisaea sp.]|uniref:type I secretion system permease/ATPase n=1 Tax=Nisaea sp. TaxID=2024842 RepID=UPI0032EBC99F
MTEHLPTRPSHIPTLQSIVAKCIPGLLLCILLSFVISLTMFVPPLYMMKLFSGVTATGSVATVVGLSVLAGGAVLLYVVLDYLRSRTYHLLSGWLAERLGDVAIEPIAAQSLRGGRPAELLKDIGMLRDFVAGGGLTAGLDLLWVPMFVAALFLLHPFFGWLGIGAGVTLLILAVANDLLTRAPVRESSERAEGAYREIADALRFAEVIDAMGMLDGIFRRWRARNRQMIAANLRGAQRQAAVLSIAKGIRLTVQLAVFGGGMLLVLEQAADFGTLLASSIILVRALAPLEQMLDRWRHWIAAAGATRRIAAALAKPPRLLRSSMPMPRPRSSLALNHVYFVPAGSNQPTVRGVSLEVGCGEFICIAGAAAAGKTTLLQLMAGMWTPTAGSITLDGHDTHSWNREDFGHHVGYLPQSVQLLGDTVRTVIARLAENDPAATVKAAELAGIHTVIGRLPNGYDSPVDGPGARLTGGQRQQIGIARALYGDPALILLDEPDGSLDSSALKTLIATLKWLRDRGRIIVVTSHRPEMLRSANRVVLLDHGAVARIATPVPCARPDPILSATAAS